MSRQSDIRAKWIAAKGKLVDVSFPKSADPDVITAILDAARGDVYYLLDRLEAAEGLLREANLYICGNPDCNFLIEQFLKESQ